MAIEFRRIFSEAKLLDPKQGFAEVVRPFEVRFDPLLGDQCRILGFRYTWKPTKPDFSELVARSLKAGCPFCPENLGTLAAKFIPELVPEGSIRRGETAVVPNLAPYNKYGAVAVISRAHFLEMKAFTLEMLLDGFLASQEYARRVVEHDPRAKYHSVSWNYMPISGAGQLHPHLQVQPDDLPFNYERKLYRACEEYARDNQSNFFADLIVREREVGERYIGTTGNIVWLTPFAPRGVMPDVVGVLQERDSFLSVTGDDLWNMSRGLCCILSYFDDQGYSSFNLGIISGLQGQGHTWTTVRVVPRVLIPPLDASDHTQMSALHEEEWVARTPEEACAEIREYFRQSP